LSRIGFLAGTAASALLIAGHSAVRAEEGSDDDAPDRDTIVVTGTREETSTPLTTRTEREALDQREVQSFEDLGRRVDAGVNFSRQTNSINLRGLDADRIRTTLDGIRLPWLGRDARGVSGGLASFDFDALGAIDIVRGADSSVAGSGALAGAIALRTLAPEDLLATGRTVGWRFGAGYDSADESWRFNHAVAGRTGDTVLLLQAARREGHELANQGEVDSYGPTRTMRNPADYEQQSLLLKAGHYFGGGHRIGLAADRFIRDQRTDLRTDQGGSFAIGQNQSSERSTRERVALTYDFTAPGAGALLDGAEAILFWQRQRLETGQRGIRTRDRRADIIRGDPFRYGFPTGPYGRDSRIEEEGIGLTARAASRVGGAVPHVLRFGADLYRADTRQYSSGFDNCPNYAPGFPQPFGPQTCIFLKTNQADQPDVRGTALGAYIEDEIGLADGRVRLTPGLRYDYYEQAPQLTAAYQASPAFAGLPPATRGDRLSGKLRGEYEPAPGTVLYAQWAQGFRAPTPSELYLRFGGPGSYLRLGNPGLEAETSNGFELGVRRDGAALSAGISLFTTDYRNFIDTVPVPAAELGLNPALYPLGITRSVNRDEVRIRGLEARLNWTFAAGWRAWGSMSALEGEDRDSGAPLNSIAPLRAILGLGYSGEAWGVDASLTAAAARDDVERPRVDFEAPAYQLVDLIAWFAPRWAGGARLQLAALNLFDETYWNALNVPEGRLPLPAAYYTEPGRTFRITLSYQF
jgi:hemoglobin/transferrin/lactoferrin receptor protein